MKELFELKKAADFRVLESAPEYYDAELSRFSEGKTVFGGETTKCFSGGRTWIRVGKPYKEQFEEV